MRLASFNVENFFARPRAMSPTVTNGSDILAAQAEVNGVLEQPTYAAADKKRILDLLTTLGVRDSDNAAYATLHQMRGHLLTRTRGTVTVTATGRGDWTGWVDLTTEPVLASATSNTARVVNDLAPDILGVVEADNRVVLKRFADSELRVGQVPRFEHVMLIDGNDDRGIDVGILARKQWTITRMLSHIDDADAGGIIFSRDCPEYEFLSPSGAQLVILINHLKSKGYGSQRENDARRRRQAKRVAQIYKNLSEDNPALHIAVIGDFNDFPTSPPLQPLLANTDLKDISTHPKFKPGPRPGTYGNCTANEKIDYILLSPSLYGKVTGGGIWRKGAWGGKNGTLWPHYPTLKSDADAASDHSAIWADVNLK
jgi:endonuclease/exonuclease/phosphatase family metal-dependent hydrolase